jgi:hypothetical protein
MPEQKKYGWVITGQKLLLELKVSTKKINIIESLKKMKLLYEHPGAITGK